jgi:hypothetical protein
MGAYTVPEGVLGVGIDGVTYSVVDGVLVLPVGLPLGDAGDGFEPCATPKGAKPMAKKNRDANDETTEPETEEPEATSAPGSDADEATESEDAPADDAPVETGDAATAEVNA